MDSLSSLSVPVVPEPHPPITATLHHARVSPVHLFIFGSLFVGLGALGGYWYAKQSMMILPEQTACTLEAKMCPDGTAVGRSGPACEFAPCPDAAPDVTASWQTHRSEILGIEFKLPQSLGLMDLSGREIAGETGTQYCMVFEGPLSHMFIRTVYAGGGACGGGRVALGSVSFDYSAGREGGFGDYTGYEKRGSEFYPRFLQTLVSQPLPQDGSIEKTNAHGVTYLRISGVDTTVDYGGEMMNMPVPGTPGRGYVGALVNHPWGQYQGFTVAMKIDAPEDEAIFDALMETIRYSQKILPSESE